MAVCLRPQEVFVYPSGSGGQLVPVTVYIPDSFVSVENCQTLLISADQIPPNVFIDNAEDAAAISAAFIMLIVTAGIFRFLRRQIEDSDISYSDEKH